MWFTHDISTKKSPCTVRKTVERSWEKLWSFAASTFSRKVTQQYPVMFQKKNRKFPELWNTYFLDVTTNFPVTFQKTLEGSRPLARGVKGGHPPKYWPRSMWLDFGDCTRTGTFNLVRILAVCKNVVVYIKFKLVNCLKFQQLVVNNVWKYLGPFNGKDCGPLVQDIR